MSGTFTNVVFAWVPPHLRPLALTTAHDVAVPELDVPALDTAVRAELHAYPPLIKARMQAAGTGMIGFQAVHGLNTFRMICMSPTLQPPDVDALLETIDTSGLDAVTAGP